MAPDSEGRRPLLRLRGHRRPQAHRAGGQDPGSEHYAAGGAAVQPGMAPVRLRSAEHAPPLHLLAQSLKQKLAEGELKRRDEDQMLLNVADTMSRFEGYIGASPEEMQARAEEARE